MARKRTPDPEPQQPVIPPEPELSQESQPETAVTPPEPDPLDVSEVSVKPEPAIHPGAIYPESDRFVNDLPVPDSSWGLDDLGAYLRQVSKRSAKDAWLIGTAIIMAGKKFKMTAAIFGSSKEIQRKWKQWQIEQCPSLSYKTLRRYVLLAQRVKYEELDNDTKLQTAYDKGEITTKKKTPPAKKDPKKKDSLPPEPEISLQEEDEEDEPVQQREEVPPPEVVQPKAGPYMTDEEIAAALVKMAEWVQGGLLKIKQVVDALLLTKSGGSGVTS